MPDGHWRSLFERRQSGRSWKYWIDARTSEEHAYDQSADPGESRNVIDEMAVELRREWRLRVLPALTQLFPRL